MIDRPDATLLLEAMAATLADKVMPELSGGAQHQARIVANLCRIVARDLADDATDTAAALTALPFLQSACPCHLRGFIESARYARGFNGAARYAPREHAVLS